MITTEDIITIIRDNWKYASKRIPGKHRKTLRGLNLLIPGFDGNAIRLSVAELPKLLNGGMVFISGPVGVGKTIGAIILAILFTGKTNRRFTIINSRDVLKNDFKERWEREDWSNDPGLIVVDDFGQEHFRADNDYGRDVWEDFIDTSYREGYPRIYTTNLKPEEVRAKYGDRVYDRLKEVGVWITVTEPGGSFRGRKVEK